MAPAKWLDSILSRIGTNTDVTTNIQEESVHLTDRNYPWHMYTEWKPNHMQVLLPDEVLPRENIREEKYLGLSEGDHLWSTITGSRDIAENACNYDLGQDSLRYDLLAQIGIESFVGMVTERHAELAVDGSNYTVRCKHFWCDALGSGMHQRMVVEFYPTTLKEMDGITAVGAFVHAFDRDCDKSEFTYADKIPIEPPNIKLIFIPKYDGRIEVMMGSILPATSGDMSYRGQGLMDQDSLEHLSVYPRSMPTIWVDDAEDRIRFVLICVQDADQFGILPAKHFEVPLSLEKRTDVKGERAFATRRWQAWQLADSGHARGDMIFECRSIPDYLPLLDLG